MASDFSIKNVFKKEDGGREYEKKSAKPKRYFDYTLLFIVVFMIVFGLIMIYSISAYNATKYYDETIFIF